MLVEVSGQRLTFPQFCACCCGIPNGTFHAAHSKSKGKRVVHTKTWSWDFPYCTTCLAHVQAWRNATTAGGAWGALLFVLAGLIAAVTGDGGWVVVAALISGVVAGVVGKVHYERKAQQMCRPDCVVPAAAVQYVDWYGTAHKLNFFSSRYATLFMLANSQKLVNVTPDARKLMELGLPTGLSQVSISSMPRRPEGSEGAFVSAPSTSDDEELVRILSKLESLKGVASRSAARDASIKKIHGEPARKRLLLEAARIEVTAALEKIDTLKTKGAKSRVIQEALESVRNSGLDEAEQTRQVEPLVSALQGMN